MQSYDFSISAEGLCSAIESDEQFSVQNTWPHLQLNNKLQITQFYLKADLQKCRLVSLMISTL